jgi:hypothetical protein
MNGEISCGITECFEESSVIALIEAVQKALEGREVPDQSENIWIVDDLS